MEQCLTQISTSEVLLLGDFNIRIGNDNERDTRLTTLLSLYNFQQLIEHGTHVYNSFGLPQESLIDLICSNRHQRDFSESNIQSFLTRLENRDWDADTVEDAVDSFNNILSTLVDVCFPFIEFTKTQKSLHAKMNYATVSAKLTMMTTVLHTIVFVIICGPPLRMFRAGNRGQLAG